jgi:hypothetical protein
MPLSLSRAYKLTVIPHQLTSRLSAHELANSRSFSTAVQSSKRPIPNPTDVGTVRHFNTSRSLKAVKDSSTIDFAYIPDFDPDTRSAPVEIRVPILPQNSSVNVAAAEETEEVVRARPVPTARLRC